MGLKSDCVETTHRSSDHFVGGNKLLKGLEIETFTAKQWRDAHPDAEGNVRDHATLEQLVVLTNLESLNSVLVRQGLPSRRAPPPAQ